MCNIELIPGVDMAYNDRHPKPPTPVKPPTPSPAKEPTPSGNFKKIIHFFDTFRVFHEVLYVFVSKNCHFVW